MASKPGVHVWALIQQESALMSHKTAESSEDSARLGQHTSSGTTLGYVPTRGQPKGFHKCMAGHLLKVPLRTRHGVSGPQLHTSKVEVAAGLLMTMRPQGRTVVKWMGSTLASPLVREQVHFVECRDRSLGITLPTSAPLLGHAHRSSAEAACLLPAQLAGPCTQQVVPVPQTKK